MKKHSTRSGVNWQEWFLWNFTILFDLDKHDRGLVRERCSNISHSEFWILESSRIFWSDLFELFRAEIQLWKTKLLYYSCLIYPFVTLLTEYQVWTAAMLAAYPDETSRLTMWKDCLVVTVVIQAQLRPSVGGWHAENLGTSPLPPLSLAVLYDNNA